MPRIFLSYRRQDSIGVAGRIYDRLRAHFGNDAVFMDIDSISFGEDFREHIDAAVGQCDVVLAVIGPKWAGEAAAHRRLDGPRDFVRIELESALNRSLPVIPILIDHAMMPGEADLPASLARLAFRNAIDVDQGRDFHPHVDRLIRGIEFHFQKFKGSDDLPVESVSWLNAVAFCNKLSEREKRSPFYRINGNAVTVLGGDGYRLPTEAEWEYVCRAGSSTLYPFGDDASALGEFAWYDKNSEKKTHPVGQKSPNAWGLHEQPGLRRPGRRSGGAAGRSPAGLGRSMPGGAEWEVVRYFRTESVRHACKHVCI